MEIDLGFDRDVNRIVLPPASYLHEREKIDKRWPAAVKGFMSKAKGAEAIIDEAEKILRRDRMLKRWLKPNGPNASASGLG